MIIIKLQLETYFLLKYPYIQTLLPLIFPGINSFLKSSKISKHYQFSAGFHSFDAHFFLFRPYLAGFSSSESFID